MKLFVNIVVLLLFAVHSVCLKANAQAEWMVYDCSNTPELCGCRIKDLAIDKYGNKWLATENCGLIKFDNFNWTVYNSSNSCVADDIEQIVIDTNQQIWYAKYFGVYRNLWMFDGINCTDFSMPSFSMDVWSLAIDDSNYVWTSGGSMIIDPPFPGIRKTNANTGISEWLYPFTYNFFEFIGIDNQGNKWMCCTSGPSDTAGIVKFDGENWVVYDTSISPFPAITYDIAADSSNVWIATNFGLVKYDSTNFSVYDSSNTCIPGKTVNSVAIDENGNKWLGSAGLVMMNDTSCIVFDTSNSPLPYNSAANIIIDTYNNKWLTFSGGVNYDCALIVYREGGVILDTIEVGIPDNNNYSNNIIVNNFPNPFSTATTISYKLNKAVHITLNVYSPVGQRIATLTDSKQQPGIYRIVFDASGLSPGIYFYILKTLEHREIRKMILIR